MAADRKSVLFKFPPELLEALDKHAASTKQTRMAAGLELIRLGLLGGLAKQSADAGIERAREAVGAYIEASTIAKHGARSPLNLPVGYQRPKPGSLLKVKK